MPDYQPGLAYAGIAQGLAAFGEAQEEQKTRAREFKALQEFADATGIAGKDQTTVMDLESLKGFVRGAESKRAIQEQQRKAQMEQAQFENLQKHQAEMLGVSRQGMALEGMRTLGGLFNQTTDNNLKAQEFAERQRMNGETLSRFAGQEQKAAQEAVALAGFAKDFSGYAGEDFTPDGVGMLRPMGDAERFRSALQRNPAAFASDKFDSNATALGRFSGGGAAFNPSLSVQTATLSDGTVVEIPVGRVGPNGAQFFPEFSPVGNRKYSDKAGAAGAKVARPTTEIERHRMIADNEKAIAALRTRAADPKIQGAEYMDAMRQIRRKQTEIDGWLDDSGTSPAPAASAPAAAPSAPQVGEERRGYIYQGGDPSQPSSWKKK